MPSTLAASTPNQRRRGPRDPGCSRGSTAKPTTAPISIMPSTPRLMNPALLDHELSPVAARSRSAFVTATTVTRALMMKRSSIHVDSLRAGAARGASRTIQMRKRSSTSLASMMKNSIVAGKMSAVASGNGTIPSARPARRHLCRRAGRADGRARARGDRRHFPGDDAVLHPRQRHSGWFAHQDRSRRAARRSRGGCRVMLTFIIDALVTVVAGDDADPARRHGRMWSRRAGSSTSASRA